MAREQGPGNAAVPAYLGNDFSEAPPGHRFYLYLPLWGERWHGLETTDETLTPLARVGDDDRSRLKALADRQKAFTDDATLIQPADAVAPFTTGLGMEHPLENGFAFLTPYGLPYLPGSSVKGVLRQAARELSPHVDSPGPDFADPDWQWGEAALEALFGSAGEEAGEEAPHRERGALICRDVYPVLPSEADLRWEIMTPHHASYYQGKNEVSEDEKIRVPHDNEAPVPILFLTLPPGTRFDFRVDADRARLRQRTPELLADDPATDPWRELVGELFEHAFEWLGFGAKTSVGYGAMEALSGAELNRCDWVDETIAALAKQHNAKERDILVGKPLANAWAALEDPELKERALVDIRSRWQAEGWWDEPQGKAAKKAKAIYEGRE